MKVTAGVLGSGRVYIPIRMRCLEGFATRAFICTWVPYYIKLPACVWKFLTSS